MTVLLSLILTAIAFTLAIYPLLKKKTAYSVDSAGDENLAEMQAHRDTAYSMLKELDFDYQSGILSDDDYEALRNRYKQKAVNILKDMDELHENNDAGDEIEKKVLALRKKKPDGSRAVDTSDEIEKKVLALRKKKAGEPRDVDTSNEIEKSVMAVHRRGGKFCPQCGVRHDPDDRFCVQCGTKLFKEID